jgi:hypothetical protein
MGLDTLSSGGIWEFHGIENWDFGSGYVTVYFW